MFAIVISIGILSFICLLVFIFHIAPYISDNYTSNIPVTCCKYIKNHKTISTLLIALCLLIYILYMYIANYQTKIIEPKNIPERTIQKYDEQQTSNTIPNQYQKSGSSPQHAPAISDSDITGASNTSTPSRLSTDTPQGAINDHS